MTNNTIIGHICLFEPVIKTTLMNGVCTFTRFGSIVGIKNLFSVCKANKTARRCHI